MAIDFVVPALGDEFKGASLGDARRVERIVAMVERLGVAPDSSFPKLLKSEAELEGAYRILRNEAVSPAALLGAHVEATAARSQQWTAGPVLVVHDTSEFSFPGKMQRPGTGPLPNGDFGFIGMPSLVVGLGENGTDSRVPLGVVGFGTLVRDGRPTTSLNKQKMASRKKPRSQKESNEWSVAAERAAIALNPVDPIHVIDRGADDYVLFAELVGKNRRFVIRGSSSRVLEGSSRPKVADRLKASETILLREIELSKRNPGPHKRHTKTNGPRRARHAALQIRACTIQLPKPQHAQSTLSDITLNVVQVLEADPPKDETPVEWTLYTTEPISSPEEVASVVDAYRARWLIEEYFRALKQGCGYERRQLEGSALFTALVLFAVIAWRILLLRSLARHRPTTKASTIFSKDELACLSAISERVKIAPDPTVHQVWLALAGMGGHLKRSGEPGWLTLSRGYQDFLLAYSGWRAAGQK